MHRLRVLCLSALATVCTQRTHATTFFYDSNQAATGIGAVVSPANWLANNWSTLDTGTATTAAWPNANPNFDIAVFKGTAGAVNVAADVFTSAIQIQTANYNISGAGRIVLSGTTPNINVSLPASGNIATISTALSGNAFTLDGNSLSGGLKFLVLSNASATNPNTFTGTLTISAGGSLRLGGGAANEQIPDSCDLDVSGVLDFVTSGGASDGKNERARDVHVNGANANFSVGNGANFIVNTISATNTSGAAIALNGNNAANPTRLTIESNTAALILNNGAVRLNTTGATSAIGSAVRLAGDIRSTGASTITNINGPASSAATNTFSNKSFTFTSNSHEIEVTSGTLTLTAAAANHPLAIGSVGSANLIKTGGGVLVYANAVQSAFTGVNTIQSGTLQLAAAERLAGDVIVDGGALDIQSFAESVQSLRLNAGEITGSGTFTASALDLRSGTIRTPLAGSAAMIKTTTGTVTLGPAAHAQFINGTGGVDLQLGGLGLDYNGGADPAPSVLPLLAVGYAAQFQTGQIRSSTATTTRGIGYRREMASESLLLAAVLYGDANLDGTVNISDFSALAASFNVSGEWTSGDFNYDGVINIADFALLAGNFNQTISARTSLPEPSLVAIPLLTFAGRRRKLRI